MKLSAELISNSPNIYPNKKVSGTKVMHRNETYFISSTPFLFVGVSLQLRQVTTVLYSVT
jgi:hypothetical protein